MMPDMRLRGDRRYRLVRGMYIQVDVLALRVEHAC